ncbi:MAG: hypothetical protein QXU21_08575 [Candidatus Bathyarchaeia archaeon]
MSKSNITFEDFKSKWEQIISKIENEAIDGEGIIMIRYHFDRSKALFINGLNEDEYTYKILVELDILTKLETALQIAHSSFRLKNLGILARIFGGIFELIKRGK